MRREQQRCKSCGGEIYFDGIFIKLLDYRDINTAISFKYLCFR